MNRTKLLFCFLAVLVSFSSCSTLDELKTENKKLKYDLETSTKQSEKKVEKINNRMVKLKQEKDSLQRLVDRLSFVIDSLGVNPERVAKGINDDFIIDKKYIAKVKNKKTDKNNNESISLELKNLTFQAYVIDDPTTIDFFWKDEKGKLINNLKNLKDKIKAEERELIFGMNAGIFTRGQIPEGLFVQKGVEKIKLNEKKGKGNFYLEPNGVFIIEKDGKSHVIETKAFKEKKDSFDIWNATQSGPMLVIDGKVHDVFVEGSSNLNIRNGVGVTEDGKVVFLISSRAINLYTFASIFRNHFRCKNALYLDGAISQAFIPELNKHGLTGNFGPLIGVVKK